MRTIKAETFGVADDFVATEKAILDVLQLTHGVVIHDTVQFTDQHGWNRTALAVSLSDETRKELYIEHGMKFAREWDSFKTFNNKYYVCFRD